MYVWFSNYWLSYTVNVWYWSSYWCWSCNNSSGGCSISNDNRSWSLNNRSWSFNNSWTSSISWESWKGWFYDNSWLYEWSWSDEGHHDRLRNDGSGGWLLPLLLLGWIGDWAVSVSPPVLGNFVVLELVDVEWRCSPVSGLIVIVSGHIVALMVNIFLSVIWIYMNLLWLSISDFFTWG